MAYPDPPTTPPVPQRGDRTTFASRVDAFLTWVAAIIPWLRGFTLDFMANLTTLAAGGANSFRYVFDASTGDADPGPGEFRFNSATQNGSSILFLNTSSGGTDISKVLAALVGRTSSIKGTIRLQRFNDLSAWMILDVIGFTVGSGYYKLNVIVRASTSTNPFSGNDSVVVFIEPSGEKGANGTIGYAKFADVKPSGTSAGQTVIGNQERILNTQVYNDIVGASLAGNVVTLPAGSYEVEARTPVYGGGGVRAILNNITDGTFIYGSSGRAEDDSETRERFDCRLIDRFTITSAKQFKLLTRIQSSTGSTLGFPTSQPGVVEIYSEIVFRKIT